MKHANNCDSDRLYSILYPERRRVCSCVIRGWAADELKNLQNLDVDSLQVSDEEAIEILMDSGSVTFAAGSLELARRSR